ncbi:MAG: AMP-binding protein [Microthrixaceae bacterium]
MARHLTTLIARHVQRQPHAVLVQADRDQEALSYGTCWRWAARAADTLAGAGAAQGRPVVVRAPKSVEALAAYLGAMRLGAVWTPVAPGATDAELRHVLADAAPTLVVDGARAIEDLVGPRPSADTGAPGRPALDDPAGDPELDDPRLDPGGTAAMLYTSGTTGRPKGVPLSGSALAANALALCDAWRFTRDDVLVHALPTHHAHGLFVGLGCVLASGASMRWLDRFEAEAVVEALPHATVFMGVPTYYERLMRHDGFTPAACANLRLATSGSAPLSSATRRRVASRTGLEVVERYGMTETLMITSNPLDGARKPGSVGTALPGVEVRVDIGRSATDVGSNRSGAVNGGEAAGGEAAGGEVGIVEVRGPSVFDGYQGGGRTGTDWTEDGWFRTGDLGWMDGDGYLHLVGRAKDVIITGGLNVYPAEVEAAVADVEGVAEVAVIGLPDTEWGERVAAVVVPSDAAALDDAVHADLLRQELAAGARQALSAYKVPKRWELVADLPRNSMGKVTKNALRSRYSSGGARPASDAHGPT